MQLNYSIYSRRWSLQVRALNCRAVEQRKIGIYGSVASYFCTKFDINH